MLKNFISTPFHLPGLIFLLCFLFACEEEVPLEKPCASSASAGEPSWINAFISKLESGNNKDWGTFGSFSISGVDYYVVGNCNPFVNYAPGYQNCEGEVVKYGFIKEELEKEGEIHITQVFDRVSYIWCGDSCDC